MASPAAARIDLVPWDPTSEKHYERMLLQRRSCGWAEDEVPAWKTESLAGRKFMFWLTLVEGAAGRDEILKRHWDAVESEREPLVDTAATSMGLPRTPNQAEFHPVGHIGVAIGNEMISSFSLPLAQDVLWLKSLYISRPLHADGLGRAAMEQIERLAASPPLNADMMYLDTIEAKWQLQERQLVGIYDNRGIQRPSNLRASQSWYERQGYELLKFLPQIYDWAEPGANEPWMVDMVVMGKKLPTHG